MSRHDHTQQAPDAAETPDEVRHRIETVAGLLRRASRTATGCASALDDDFEKASGVGQVDDPGRCAALHSLSLGLYLAAARTQQLVAPQAWPPAPERVRKQSVRPGAGLYRTASAALTSPETHFVVDAELLDYAKFNEAAKQLRETTVQILSAAEQLCSLLSRMMPDDQQLQVRQLVIDISDLLCEVRHLER